ncbi:hypothetical protein, partial [Hungatella hathewayi]|uniref:hypothetical protein n=1 Tax=Hungatella hathewayi TaxID=154046 RepID=UPI001A99B1A9
HLSVPLPEERGVLWSHLIVSYSIQPPCCGIVVISGTKKEIVSLPKRQTKTQKTVPVINTYKPHKPGVPANAYGTARLWRCTWCLITNSLLS